MVGLEVQQKYVGGLKGESQMQLGRRVSGSCTDGWRQGEVLVVLRLELMDVCL